MTEAKYPEVSVKVDASDAELQKLGVESFFGLGPSIPPYGIKEHPMPEQHQFKWYTYQPKIVGRFNDVRGGIGHIGQKGLLNLGTKDKNILLRPGDTYGIGPDTIDHNSSKVLVCLPAWDKNKVVTTHAGNMKIALEHSSAYQGKPPVEDTVLSTPFGHFHSHSTPGEILNFCNYVMDVIEKEVKAREPIKANTITLDIGKTLGIKDFHLDVVLTSKSPESMGGQAGSAADASDGMIRIFKLQPISVRSLANVRFRELAVHELTHVLQFRNHIDQGVPGTQEQGMISDKKKYYNSRIELQAFLYGMVALYMHGYKKPTSKEKFIEGFEHWAEHAHRGWLSHVHAHKGWIRDSLGSIYDSYSGTYTEKVATRKGSVKAVENLRDGLSSNLSDHRFKSSPAAAQKENARLISHHLARLETSIDIGKWSKAREHLDRLHHAHHARLDLDAKSVESEQ